MPKFDMPENMKIASIWVVWGFISIGALGWALFVVLCHFGVESTAAAWVQAVGSVGAILTAVWVSERGHKRDRERAEKEAAGECTRLIGLAERAVYEAVCAIEQLPIVLADYIAGAAIQLNLVRLEQVADILRGVILQPLPHSTAKNVFEVLAHVAELSTEVRSWSSINHPPDWRSRINAHFVVVNRCYSRILRQKKM